METVEKVYNMIIEPQPIAIFFIIALSVVLLGNYYISQNAKKKKNHILDKIPHNEKNVHLDVKVSHYSRTFGAARISCHRAEIIFSRNSIFYFGYSKFGFLRMYKSVMQLYIPGENLPDQLIKSEFAPIQSIMFREGEIIIEFAWSSSPVIKCTLTLKRVENKETIQAIKRLLDLDVLQSV